MESPFPPSARARPPRSPRCSRPAAGSCSPPMSMPTAMAWEARWRCGICSLRATIANPTPIPERFHFLLPEGADHSERAAREIAAADVVVVLDISEVSRLGDLARAITQSHAVACIDHHVSVGSLPGGPRLVAPEAAATAELVFDFASALQWPLCPEAARALYVCIVTETGGFRFANTTPRVLRVAGALLEHGVDPESIYESVYA